MFRLEIETSNAAFGDDPQGEIARILREVADAADEWSVYQSATYTGTMRDLNGNTVGQWQFTADAEEAANNV